MKLILKNNSFKELNFNFEVKKNDESKKMFAKRIANIICEKYKNGHYINLDKLQLKIKNNLLIFMILREVSFIKEKLFYRNEKNELEVNIFSKEQDQWEKYTMIINVISKVRNLQDMPQNILTPKKFLQEAKKVFGDSIKKVDEEILKKMNLFNLVGNSSKNKQEFIIIENGSNIKGDPIVLIGKGVTYDAGGYNLKNGKNLLGMKADMSGAAIMFGVMDLLKHNKVNKKVICILPIVENLIGIDSMQPQMIIQSFDKTYVEIKNTDAEGRLINADAISYARKIYSPKIIIEASTLTGSVTTTLSNIATALFSNNYSIANKFIEIEKISGEKFVIFRRYKEVINKLYNSSSIADIANVNWENKMTSLYAFEFLNHFAKDVDFIHLDIAGTAVMERDRGTGETTFSIFEFVKNYI